MVTAEAVTAMESYVALSVSELQRHVRTGT
jgi:hypothetical protein